MKGYVEWCGEGGRVVVRTCGGVERSVESGVRCGKRGKVVDTCDVVVDNCVVVVDNCGG